jgi:hypothetical protein
MLSLAGEYLDLVCSCAELFEEEVEEVGEEKEGEEEEEEDGDDFICIQPTFLSSIRILSVLGGVARFFSTQYIYQNIPYVLPLNYQMSIKYTKCPYALYSKWP